MPRIAGCKFFPERNVWNRRIDQLPVHPSSRKIKEVVDTRKLRNPK